jgi:hypothetical protein
MAERNSAPAPFASPALRPRQIIRTPANALSWATAGVASAAPNSSPYTAVDSIIYYADDLTNSAERLTHSAGMALATGGVIPSMDVEDAKDALKCVAKKVIMRAKKRKAEEGRGEGCCRQGARRRRSAVWESLLTLLSRL